MIQTMPCNMSKITKYLHYSYSSYGATAKCALLQPGNSRFQYFAQIFKHQLRIMDENRNFPKYFENMYVYWIYYFLILINFNLFLTICKNSRDEMPSQESLIPKFAIPYKTKVLQISSLIL